jgi:hypothetical protein
MRLRTAALVALTLLTPACAARIRAEVTTGIWTEVCPGGTPEEARLRFLEGGTFKFSYPEPNNWQGDPNETWSVKGRTLTVSWNNGYAVNEYDVRKVDARRFEGTSSKASCRTTIVLRRDAK